MIPGHLRLLYRTVQSDGREMRKGEEEKKEQRQGINGINAEQAAAPSMYVRAVTCSSDVGLTALLTTQLLKYYRTWTVVVVQAVQIEQCLHHFFGIRRPL